MQIQLELQQIFCSEDGGNTFPYQTTRHHMLDDNNLVIYVCLTSNPQFRAAHIMYKRTKS
jgi:hypothetical protein